MRMIHCGYTPGKTMYHLIQCIQAEGGARAKGGVLYFIFLPGGYSHSDITIMLIIMFEHYLTLVEY